MSEANIGSTSVSNRGCPITTSPFVWGQETLPSSLVFPTAHELPSIANLGAGRHEIPSIRRMFDLTPTPPHQWPAVVTGHCPTTSIWELGIFS
jgi:hypothetical protein